MKDEEFIEIDGYKIRILDNVGMINEKYKTCSQISDEFYKTHGRLLTSAELVLFFKTVVKSLSVLEESMVYANVANLITACESSECEKDIHDLIIATIKPQGTKVEQYDYARISEIMTSGSLDELSDFYHHFKNSYPEVQVFWDFCRVARELRVLRFGEAFVKLALNTKFEPQGQID